MNSALLTFSTNLKTLSQFNTVQQRQAHSFSRLAQSLVTALCHSNTIQSTAVAAVCNGDPDSIHSSHMMSQLTKQSQVY